MSFEEIYERHEAQIKDLAPAVEPVEAPEAPKSDETVGSGSLPPLEMGSATLGQYFGYSELESHAPEMKGKLDDIWLMVSKMGVKDVPGYLDFIEGKIGEPKLGISRADHVYQYLRLVSTANNAYEEVKGYENKGSDSRSKGHDPVRTSRRDTAGGDERGYVGGDN